MASSLVDPSARNYEIFNTLGNGWATNEQNALAIDAKFIELIQHPKINVASLLAKGMKLATYSSFEDYYNHLLQV